MDLSQLYDPALDEYVPEALDFLSKFSFDSAVTDLSTPEGLAQARDLDSLGGGILASAVLDDVDICTYTGAAGDELELRVFAPDGPARAVYLDISPLYADLNHLCPALFSVGTLDYLYDDSLFMAARWRAADNPAELAIYPASPHGFSVFPTKMTQAANDRTDAWLAQILESTDS